MVRNILAVVLNPLVLHHIEFVVEIVAESPQIVAEDAKEEVSNVLRSLTMLVEELVQSALFENASFEEDSGAPFGSLPFQQLRQVE